MLLHCDFVVATEEARFHMPFTKLGLTPEGVSSYLLPLLVGRQRASAWILLARPFDGKEAHAAGLVNQLVPQIGLDECAESYAAEVATVPREVARLTKRLIVDGQRQAIADTMKREMEEFGRRVVAPETIEIFARFMSRK